LSKLHIILLPLLQITMKSNLVLFTTYELLLALIFGLLTIYLCIRVINTLILKIDFFRLVREGNIAVALFEGVLVLCALILVENSILPAVDALRTMVLATGGFHVNMLLISFGYFMLFYIISLAFSLILLSVCFYVFIKATKDVDELKEIKNNNIAVTLVISVVMVGITMFIRPSFNNFIGSLINYNKLENFVSIQPEEPNPDEEVTPQRRSNSPE